MLALVERAVGDGIQLPLTQLQASALDRVLGSIERMRGTLPLGLAPLRKQLNS